MLVKSLNEATHMCPSLFMRQVYRQGNIGYSMLEPSIPPHDFDGMLQGLDAYPVNGQITIIPLVLRVRQFLHRSHVGTLT
jgi:hypothetical protein